MIHASLRRLVCFSLFIVVRDSVLAADDLDDLDEKLLLTVLSRTKTDKGRMIYEGDIVDESPVNSMKALPSKGSLWTDKIVPYEFHSTVNKSTEAVIRTAMDEWEKVTCVKFVKRTSQNQYLRFRTDGGGCFTFVGKKYTAGQDVNLGPGCVHHQIAMHEIGHSLGFYHEHSRKDRGSVLKVLWQNIERGMAGQFSPGNDDPRGVPYDVTSIMHYNPMSFSSRLFERNTMVSVDPRLQPLIGRSRGITFRDAKLANMIYKCDNGCPNRGALQCQNEGYLSPYGGDSTSCKCVCPPNTSGKKCEKVTGDYYGSYLCGGELTSEGSIQTPGYPKREPDQSCTWQIKAPLGKRVEVTFQDFSFRQRMDKPSHPYKGYCVYEHVEIRTGSMDEGEMYCGEDIVKGSKMTSTSNSFFILIRADSKGHGRGLNAKIKFIS